MSTFNHLLLHKYQETKCCVASTYKKPKIHKPLKFRQNVSWHLSTRNQKHLDFRQNVYWHLLTRNQKKKLQISDVYQN